MVQRNLSELRGLPNKLIWRRRRRVWTTAWLQQRPSFRPNSQRLFPSVEFTTNKSTPVPRGNPSHPCGRQRGISFARVSRVKDGKEASRQTWRSWSLPQQREYPEFSCGYCQDVAISSTWSAPQRAHEEQKFYWQQGIWVGCTIHSFASTCSLARDRREGEPDVFEGTARCHQARWSEKQVPAEVYLSRILTDA